MTGMTGFDIKKNIGKNKKEKLFFGMRFLKNNLMSKPVIPIILYKYNIHIEYNEFVWDTETIWATSRSIDIPYGI
jgi:hypothetical protein